MDTYNPSKLTAKPIKSDLTLRQLADFDESAGDRNRVDNVRDNQVLVSLSKFNRPKTFSFQYISDLIKGGTGVTISTDKDGITSITNTGVTKIIAGTNISISPVTGIGDVTINAASGGITSLNALTGAVQTLATGTTGTDFSISSVGTAHTFNLPTASATNRGALSSTDWSTFNNKFTLPSLTSGSVLFSNGTTIAQSNANLFWDNTNNRLGIGTSSPTTTVDIVKSYAGALDNLIPQLRFQNSSVAASADLYALARVLVGTGYVGSYPEIWVQAYRSAANVGTASIRVVSNHPLTFLTSDSERARIFANGNFAIGTTTDAGFKLDVNGTTRITGTGTTSTTTALIVRNNTGTTLLSVRDDNYVLTTNLATTSIFALNYYTNGTGASLNLYGGTSGVANSFVFNSWGSTDTIGSSNFVNISRVFNPTSGTGVYNTLLLAPTINQTGGANGITRGLYINPTLTAAADFRAIETTAGNVLFGSNFFWDNTNTRLNVGTNLGAYGRAWIQSDLASTDDYTLVLNNRNTLGVGGESTGLYFANSGYGAASQPYNIGHIVGSIKTLATNFNNVTSRGVMTFNLNNSSSVQEEVMRLVNTTKNVLIGTTTDAGYKLDVNGTGRIVTSLIIGDTGNPSGSLIVGRTISIGYVATVGANQSFRLGGSGATINTNSFLMSSGGYNNQLGAIGICRYVVGAAPTSVGANSVTNLYVIGTEAIKLNDGTSSGINSFYNAGIVTIDLSVMETSVSGNSNVYVGKFAFRFKRYLINGVGTFTDISAVTNLYNSADATLVGTTLTAVANGTDALDLRVTLPATANTANYRMGANVTITKVNINS